MFFFLFSLLKVFIANTLYFDVCFILSFTVYWILAIRLQCLGICFSHFVLPHAHTILCEINDFGLCICVGAVSEFQCMFSYIISIYVYIYIHTIWTEYSFFYLVVRIHPMMRWCKVHYMCVCRRRWTARDPKWYKTIEWPEQMRSGTQRHLNSLQCLIRGDRIQFPWKQKKKRTDHLKLMLFTRAFNYYDIDSCQAKRHQSNWTFNKRFMFESSWSFQLF